MGWSRGVLSASHTLLHHELKYIGMRQAAVCRYDPLAVLQLHIASYTHGPFMWHYSVEYRLWYSIEFSIFFINCSLDNTVVTKLKERPDWETGEITNPSAPSAPRTAPQTNQYAAKFGCWFFRATVGAKDSAPANLNQIMDTWLRQTRLTYLTIQHICSCGLSATRGMER